jgi:hypothetical protein
MDGFMTNGWIHASYKLEQGFQYKTQLSRLLLLVLQASVVCSLAVDRFPRLPSPLFLRVLYILQL